LRVSDGRAGALAELARERDLDAVLVLDPTNVRYLTGFTGSNALIVVSAAEGGPRTFITDFRYVGRAAEEVDAGFTRVEGERDLFESIAGALPEAADSKVRLGFDDAKTSVRTHAKLAKLLADEAELVAAGGLVEQLRMVKDSEELAAIERAAALADEALTTVLGRGIAGKTEREVALGLEHEMRLRGAEPSFDSIVAAGVHGAQPHAEPGDAVIERDVLVTIDWGARIDGYCSDCTRTYATGTAVGEEALEVYELVRRAQEAGLEAVAPGVIGRDADAAARAIIADAGRGEQFGHGLGHGVGLEVHEEPRLSKAGDTALATGHVVTVEPGVYVAGTCGVRIEDLVVVTGDGHRVLSSLPKALQVVD
jgi:Xaa-Pro aminopeptidase